MYSAKDIRQLHGEREMIIAAMNATLHKIGKLTTTISPSFDGKEEYYKNNIDNIVPTQGKIIDSLISKFVKLTPRALEKDLSLSVTSGAKFAAKNDISFGSKFLADGSGYKFLQAFIGILEGQIDWFAIHNLLHSWEKFCVVCISLFIRSTEDHVDQKLNENSKSQLLSKLLKTEAVLTRDLKDVSEEHTTQKQFLEREVHEWKQKVIQVNTKEKKRLSEAIKSNSINEILMEKKLENDFSACTATLKSVNIALTNTVTFTKQSTKSLRGRRHYLEASLDSLIREYDVTVLKFQGRIDDLSLEEEKFNREVEALQAKFKDVEEKYDEMRAMRRLKELLANMEKAEAIKQNWAARKIQICWRKYKIAKLRKKKLKGRRKGKKKTPPPGKASSPGKASTSDSRSRSKSQTP